MTFEAIMKAEMKSQWSDEHHTVSISNIIY